jgi:hypothetical protein
MLWDPPTEIQASGFRSAARRFCWLAERCSEARVRLRRGTPPRPCLLCAVLQTRVIATGGSDGNQKQNSFFVLQKTNASVELTKHHRRSRKGRLTQCESC